MDDNCIHKNIAFPQHNHVSLCDVSRLEPAVTSYLMELGIEINLQSRITNVKMDGKHINAVALKDGTVIEGDVFIDATGSTGATDNCMKYGNGCAMCILRCPTFGGRVSISALAGAMDIVSEREDGMPGAFSGSCEIPRDCLSDSILRELDHTGVAMIKIPPEDISSNKLKMKVCQQYAFQEFSDNIILLDTGHIKLMTPFYPLDKLRKIKGLERARFMDPYSGGRGNSIRFMAASQRTNDMRVVGVDNLFCAGEKSGFFIGHTEAICTGSLAGHNSARFLADLPLLTLPRELAIGEMISFANQKLEEPDGKKVKISFSGSVFFERMKSLGLYTTDRQEIDNRVKNLGLKDAFVEQLI
jgi:hypothetical protein